MLKGTDGKFTANQLLLDAIISAGKSNSVRIQRPTHTPRNSFIATCTGACPKKLAGMMDGIYNMGKDLQFVAPDLADPIGANLCNIQCSKCHVRQDARNSTGTCSMIVPWRTIATATTTATAAATIAAAATTTTTPSPLTPTQHTGGMKGQWPSLKNVRSLHQLHNTLLVIPREYR